MSGSEAAEVRPRINPERTSELTSMDPGCVPIKLKMRQQWTRIVPRSTRGRCRIDSPLIQIAPPLILDPDQHYTQSQQDRSLVQSRALSANLRVDPTKTPLTGPIPTKLLLRFPVESPRTSTSITCTQAFPGHISPHLRTRPALSPHMPVQRTCEVLWCLSRGLAHMANQTERLNGANACNRG